jgi:hypothetical protein
MHRSGKGRDLEDGSLTRVMDSLYNLNHQFYGRYGLFRVQQKRAEHCAGKSLFVLISIHIYFLLEPLTV